MKRSFQMLSIPSAMWLITMGVHGAAKTVATLLLETSINGMFGMERKSHGITGTSLLADSLGTFGVLVQHRWHAYTAMTAAVNLAWRVTLIFGLSTTGLTATLRKDSLSHVQFAPTTRRMASSDDLNYT